MPVRAAEIDELRASGGKHHNAKSELREVLLERKVAIGRRILRVQFRFALVPGTLKRYSRASRSVIMTMAIHELHLKSASITAG